MTVATDNQTLFVATTDRAFQVRCRARFIVAAVAVTTELNTVTSHTQRLAFAGAIFGQTVRDEMLAAIVLSNATNRTNCIADAVNIGGTVLDNDIDFQITSVFTGVAVSRAWA
jgi:hypothetical protein